MEGDQDREGDEPEMGGVTDDDSDDDLQFEDEEEEEFDFSVPPTIYDWPRRADYLQEVNRCVACNETHSTFGKASWCVVEDGWWHCLMCRMKIPIGNPSLFRHTEIHHVTQDDPTIVLCPFPRCRNPRVPFQRMNPHLTLHIDAAARSGPPPGQGPPPASTGQGPQKKKSGSSSSGKGWTQKQKADDNKKSSKMGESSSSSIGAVTQSSATSSRSVENKSSLTGSKGGGRRPIKKSKATKGKEEKKTSTKLGRASYMDIDDEEDFK